MFPTTSEGSRLSKPVALSPKVMDERESVLENL